MSTQTESHQATATEAPPDGGRPRARRQDEFTTEHHVYEPHRVGLPPVGSYVGASWKRRQFALELARTNLRAQHFNTAFGQLWLLLNPLLLAFVYFLLVDILQHGSRDADFFAHLVAGLFLFQIVQNSLTHGVKSVISGGRLILNTAFPRTLLPLSSVVTAFMRFVPTLLIYVPIHLAFDLPVGAHLLWVIPLTLVMLVIAAGLAMFVAAAQVYFRDLKSFLPYVLRIWLYASPVLYYAHEVPEKYQPVLAVNPLAPVLTAWSDVLNAGTAPSPEHLLMGLAWATVLFLGGALFFISRETEFAVRL